MSNPLACKVCGHEYEAFSELILIGYLAGFDEADHAILLEARNCPACSGTFAEAVDRAVVESAVRVPGKIGRSASDALEDVDLEGGP